jgi:hypothetical protein
LEFVRELPAIEEETPQDTGVQTTLNIACYYNGMVRMNGHGFSNGRADALNAARSILQISRQRMESPEIESWCRPAQTVGMRIAEPEDGVSPNR